MNIENLDNLPPAMFQQLINQLQGMGQYEELDDEDDSDYEPTEVRLCTPLDGEKIDQSILDSLFSLEKKYPMDEETKEKIGYFALFLDRAFEGQAKTIKGVFEFLDEKYKGHSPRNGVCGKKMTLNDVGYSCLDCQMDPTCIICKECFENSNHKGHRFQIKPNVSGMCDCGDPEAWKEQGNCSKHGGFLEEDNILSEETKRKIVKEFKRFLYYVIQALELNKNCKSARIKISEQLLDLVKGVMKLNKKYATIACLFGKAFYEPFSKDFEGVKLWHRCTASIPEKEPESMLECSCTPLRALLRVNIYLKVELQDLLNEFFMFMFADYKFKRHLAIEFTRMINFQINWNRIGKIEDDKSAVSKLLQISIQIMTSGQLALDAIEEVGISNILEGLQKLVEKYKKPNGYLKFDDQFINLIWMNLHYTLMKRSALKKIFEDRASLKMMFLFLEEVIKNAPKFIYKRTDADINIESNVIQTLYFELTMLRHFTEFLSSLWSQDIESIQEGIFNFFREAKESIYRICGYAEENCCFTEGENEKNNGEEITEEKKGKSYDYASQSVITIQRLFIQSMVPYLFIEQEGENLKVVEFSKEKIVKFNSKVFDNDQDCKKFWVKMTESFAGVVGFQREMTREVWSFYGPTKDRFKWLYYNFKLHNLDLVGLQLCAINLPKKFSTFMWNNYFSCEGKNELTQFKFKEALSHYDSEKEDNRIAGILKSLADFFSYQVEIETNQHNILWILEQYINFIGRNYQALTFKNTLAGKMKNAKEDILFSMMSAVPPTEISKFIEYIKQHLEDQQILSEFFKNKSTINREKRTIIVDRDYYNKAINKVYKSVVNFSQKKKDNAKLSIANTPYSSIFWYDPNKRSEAFSEVNKKQTIASRNFVKTNKITGTLKEMIETPQIYFYPYRHTKYIRNVNFDPTKIISQFIDHASEFELTQMKSDLPQIYRAILASIDLGKHNQEFLDKVENFIKVIPDDAKSDPQFKLFNLIFGVLASKEGDVDENAEMEEELKHKKLALKKKRLAKRKKRLHSKMRSKMTNFFDKLEENVDEMVQQMEEGVTQEGESVSCVVSNQEIQNDEYYYLLSHVKFSNVSFNSLTILAFGMEQSSGTQ